MSTRDDAWTADRIPDQSGRVAVVTGASSGLGELTALELARHGARTVLAVRDVPKGERAAAAIRAAAPGARVEVRRLDLSDLASVREFAAALTADEAVLDLLVNNAGIMQTPASTTADGFELQLGTNHLGHFALTALLFGALQRGSGSRVVTVSSAEHKGGHLDFDDLQLTRSYAPRKAYQQSKMANTVFAIELDRRLRAAGSPVASVLAHPGYAATNLQSTGPRGLSALGLRLGNAVFAQSVERGVLPQLYAATAPGVVGGAFYGPSGFAELRGDVTAVLAVPRAHDRDIGRRLWEVSEELTGVTFAVPSAEPATVPARVATTGRPATAQEAT